MRSLTTAFAIGLVVYLAVFLGRYIWLPRLKGDAGIVFENARLVFAHADYTPRLALGNMMEVFPYPPSAILLFRAMAIDPTLFMVTWLMLMVTGFFLLFRISVVEERAELQSLWPLMGAGALLVAGGPVEWDLRSANCNLIYLGLILAGYGLTDRKPLVSGVLIGLSISLKLYAGLLMLWLFAHGPRQAAYACAATIFALWVVLPIAFFGVDGAIQVYVGWREQLRIITDPWVYAPEHSVDPLVITLKQAAITLTGARPDGAAIRLLVLLLQGAWTGAFVWYASRALQPFAVSSPSRAALADWTVLMLAPLPFSPWLEPHHAVPFLVGAILCLTITVDTLLPIRDRLIAAGAVGALAIVRLIGIPFSLKGLGLLVQFLALVTALGFLRPRLAKPERLVRRS